MNNPTQFRRLILGAALALAALAPAALSGSVSDAQTMPPTISPLQVRAGGTEAIISFTSPEPLAVTLDYKPLTAAAVGPQPTVHVFDGGFQPAAGATPAPSIPLPGTGGGWQWQRTYTTTHELKLTGLVSNTQYQVSVTGETRTGRRISGSTTFTTAKKRVRLILDRIQVADDGDWIGKGEALWVWSVTWAGGETGGCNPNTTSSGLESSAGVCQPASIGEGLHHPRTESGEKLTKIFAEENFPQGMPKSFTLAAGAEERDLLLPWGRLWETLVHIARFHGPTASFEWSVPQDKESASTPAKVGANAAKNELESRMEFRFELFHDNLSYPPNHGRAQVRSNF